MVCQPSAQGVAALFGVPQWLSRAALGVLVGELLALT